MNLADWCFKMAKVIAYFYFSVSVFWFFFTEDLAGPLMHAVIGLLLILVAENIRYIIWRVGYRWKGWKE